MENAIELISTLIQKDSLNGLTFSAPRNKGEELKGIIINPLNSEDYKIEKRLTKHNNIFSNSKSAILEEIPQWLSDFKQVLVKSPSTDYQVLINKKLKAKIISNNKTTDKKPHNRKKNYLIPDGTPCSFLIEIGVMDKRGKVKPNYYKKFKQINRFLEMLDDIYKNEQKENLHIVDFGCGKSYLTFAIYHYFNDIKNISASITGVDLKQEVISHCNEIAQNINYTNLKFVHGMIHDFKSDKDIDFVVTLHACDTATDDAILFSIENNAKNMFFVPCCQHELNKQLKNAESEILLKHGIFRDRMTALVTDSIRAELIAACGYKVQSMEFIDLEHTAKNILLRCQKSDKSLSQRKDAWNKFLNFKKQWQVNPYLEKGLLERGFLNEVI